MLYCVDCGAPTMVLGTATIFFYNRRVVSFPPVEEGILSAGFGDEIAGAPDSSGMYILGDEPWVNTVGDEAFHDGIGIPKFSSACPPRNHMTLGVCIFLMEEGSQHGLGMTGWDHRLLFPKRVFVCYPSEVIGMTLCEHFC